LFAQNRVEEKTILLLEKKVFELSLGANSNKNPLAQNILLQIADTAIYYQKWNIATNALMRINEDLLSEQLQDSYNFKRAYVSAAEGNFYNAFEFVGRIEHPNLNTEKLACICACMLNDTSFLFHHARLLKPTISDSLINKWGKTYPREKSERFAKGISLIIPGAGSIYTRNLKHGFTALLGCGIIAASSFYLIRKDYYIIPAVAGVGLFTRFYAGAFKNAKLDTQAWNERHLKKWQQSVCSSLLEIDVK
jgi:hypothetical protein